MKTVIMYAIKRRCFEKNNTFPIQPMPIMIVSDNKVLIQSLNTKNEYHDNIEMTIIYTLCRQFEIYRPFYFDVFSR